MSVGHDHRLPNRLSHTRELKALLSSGGAPALMRRWNKLGIESDIPYLCGYNVAGTTRYADRDFVHALYDAAYGEHLLGTAIDTGLSPDQTLECCLLHEAIEKVLLDAANAINDYRSAHEFATAAEHARVRELGSTPLRYERGLEGIIKFCTAKDPKAVPTDLDCAPYLDDPDATDKRLLKRFKELGVRDASKTAKSAVNYGVGLGAEHCSACKMWQGERNAALSLCSLVEGLVRDRFGCDKFQPAGQADTPTRAETSQVRQIGPTGGHRKILLIRHGATKLNNDDVSTDRIRGWKDIPLSSDGAKEAHRLGQKIKANPPDVLVPSDLKRAHDTAKIIGKESGVPVAPATKGFRPWNVGKLSGQISKKAIPVLADYAANKPNEPTPGGESFEDFRKRFIDGLRDTLDKHPGHVGVVTHHRGERLMHAWKAKGFPPDGSVDIKTFNQKGEATGSAQPMDIPTAALKRFERTSEHLIGGGQFQYPPHRGTARHDP